VYLSFRLEQPNPLKLFVLTSPALFTLREPLQYPQRPNLKTSAVKSVSLYESEELSGGLNEYIWLKSA
jgi:hypothetical protein